MKTWTNLLNQYLELTDTSTSNESTGGIYLNDSIRAIASIRNGKWKWLETVETMSTVASQQNYKTPNNIRKIVDIYIEVGSVIYMPTIIYDPTEWKAVLSANLGSGDVPRFIYIQDDTYQIQPIPQTSGNTIYIRGRLNLKDLTIDDYTTGTITSISNGGTAVVGSGTTWTADMVGRYIRIDETTAANGGDGMWYKIGSYTSATSIGLSKPYQGTTIAAGTATYTIGQVPPIPEAYQMAIVYRASALYWEDKSEFTKSERLWRRYDGGVEAGLSDKYGGFIGQMLDESGATTEGSYISPLRFYGRWDPNNPELPVNSSSFI